MSLYHIGAVTPVKTDEQPFWTYAQYQQKAGQWFDKAKVDHMIIEITPNGKQLHSIPFDSEAESTPVWLTEFNEPGKYAYVSLWNRNATPQLVQDKFVIPPVAPVDTTRTDAVGWAAAGIASLFGLMAFGRKKGRR